MVLALGMCAPSPLPLPRARPNPQLLTGMPIMTDFYASPVMGLGMLISPRPKL